VSNYFGSQNLENPRYYEVSLREVTMTSASHSKKLLHLLSAIFIMMFSFQLVWAGTTGKISGIVIDAESKEALPGANVVVVGTNLGASTDAEGKFFILNVPPAEYSVRATMMGYGPVIQQQVMISVDRTTTLDYTLSQAVLELGKDIVVTATRPLIEKDVASSQSITTTKTADDLPVSDIMSAVSLEPGVSVNNEALEITIRGGGNDEISFQVDGMERSDKLNDKIYSVTNSASVSEIQVLTGGFNAEYGNIRSGLFNVITKEGGQKYSGSIDYRMGPAQQKHFGPDAYGTDQYDYKTYAGANSFSEIQDVEGNTLFAGWNAIAETQNNASFMGKNDWTPAQLQEVWKWRHRPIDYTSNADHFIDAGVGGPVPGLDKLGLKDAGFFLGYKHTTQNPILPSISENNKNNTFEGKLHFRPIKPLKVVISGLYGKTATSAEGETWGDQVSFNYGYDTVGSALGRDKYYLAADDLMDVWTKQIGAKITHTLSPSTYYEVRYSYFSTETEAGPSAARSDASATTIGGVQFNEAPLGWVNEATSLTDLTGTYDFFGGGRVTDSSYVKSHKLNLDLTSQLNNENMVKVGFEWTSDHVVRDNRKAGAIILEEDAGNFLRYDETPFHIAGYIQDKLEYGGMIANIGLRIEHYDGNSNVYDPGNLYSMLWARGGTEGYASPADLPQEKSKSQTYLAPRVAFSHPVREHTKFFFNYGVYYSEPTNRDRYGLFSESWDFGNGQGDIRFVGYPDLEAPRTAAYEVGFEQSVGDQWHARAYFYSKDNTEQIGGISVSGLDGSQAIGDFRNYEGVGKGAAGYQTRRNNNYEDIRGIEVKITKMRGRYFTGWLNMDYVISTSGNYGLQRFEQDPLAAYYAYSAVKLQPQTTPSFIANFDFHTPSDWSVLTRDWRLSVIQRWSGGAKVIYNPTGLPTREVRTVYYWKNYYTTTLRLNKSLNVFENLGVRLYMDVNNLFNYKRLNTGVLNTAERDLYYGQFIDDENGFGKNIGEFEDNNGADIFTENWTDSNGVTRAPIAPAKDFALFYNPRSILLGIKLEF
jgi:hypothetical protein